LEDDQQEDVAKHIPKAKILDDHMHYPCKDNILYLGPSLQYILKCTGTSCVRRSCIPDIRG
jgi:hypothetical protein